MTSPLLQQTDIFLSSEEQLQFAELCNALYERELKHLSQSSLPIERLKRRLAGLSFHIRGAAEKLMQSDAPIQLDTHNASWQYKQGARCPGAKADTAKNLEWFTRYTRPGLVVAVYVNEMGIEYMELDSVDRIDLPDMRLHTNRFGWFDMQGQHTTQTKEASPNQHLGLNRPSKNSLVAACCGHRWNHKGKTQPRALSIRELLLSTAINWQNYR